MDRILFYMVCSIALFESMALTYINAKANHEKNVQEILIRHIARNREEEEKKYNEGMD